VPLFLRRASKRQRQPNPRQAQQPRVLQRRQLKRPVRRPPRNLPHQPLLLVERANLLLLNRRLLRKFVGFHSRSLLPKSCGRRFLLYGGRLNEEARMSNDEGNPNDEPRKPSYPNLRHSGFVINSSFVIRISSFPKLMRCRNQPPSPFRKPAV
jgi:hypothetical protein